MASLRLLHFFKKKLYPAEENVKYFSTSLQLSPRYFTMLLEPYIYLLDLPKVLTRFLELQSPIITASNLTTIRATPTPKRLLRSTYNTQDIFLSVDTTFPLSFQRYFFLL